MYFLPEDVLEVEGPRAIEKALESWLRSKAVTTAIDTLQGRPWSSMSPSERIQFAVNKTYNEMAYFLYSRNYAELTGPDRQKADTCRTVLEAKLAGTSGQLTGVEKFWDDVLSGRVKISALMGGPGTAPTPRHGDAAPEGQAASGALFSFPKQ